MSKNNIQAIIFDMDGVIIDSEALHIEAEKQTLKDHSIIIPDSEWQRFKGTTYEWMYQYIIDHFTDGSITAEKLVKHTEYIYLKTAAKKLKLIPGAKEYLKIIKKTDKKVALTTSSKKRLQTLAFDKFHLHPYFDVVVTGDNIKNGKPHPEPYLKTIEKLGIPGSHCVVIEDSKNGIISAKTAGCIVVGITTSFPKNDLLKAGADYTINTFAELYDILTSSLL